ncbi:hypothetical protein ACHHV8_19555 [Paenibacillus sp. TAB 01]|uniref:hypothetical protein n=1 Tax=Paenibacillus sp. TAB 01 TaxID=3368988 RepID=UPI003751CD24
MGGVHSEDVDRFLAVIAYLESEVNRLLMKTELTQEERDFIWDHIIIVPGKEDRM